MVRGLIQNGLVNIFCSKLLISDLASGIDRHPDRTEIYFRLQIQDNRKHITCSGLFKEVFSHPYISFFHLLVNGFSVIIIIIIIIFIINFFIQVFSEYTEAVTTSLIPIDAIIPEICTLSLVLAVLRGLK